MEEGGRREGGRDGEVSSESTSPQPRAPVGVWPGSSAAADV